ncbi:MAG: hypothetical protein K0S74_940 [Chlamydiales bacterium]|jgi:FkbM family methyltransferase|nr:hypothetical protein [Chlamydiales bacterium]
MFKILKKLFKKNKYPDLPLATKRTLKNLAARNMSIATIIDIGASDGRWSVQARDVWPDAKFHLIEANNYHQPLLEKLSKNDHSFSYSLAAAGRADGVIYFDESDPFGGRAFNSSEGVTNNLAKVKQVSVDAEIQRLNLKGPYLIKLDTHGYEVPILEGAINALKDTELVILETYNFQQGPEGLLFYEMCAYMHKLGFRVIDISEPLWRKKDGAFWQIDIFFIKESRPEFDNNEWV